MPALDFETVKRVVLEIFEETKSNKAGKCATYIPQLAKVNPDLYAISVCTIAGDQFAVGDSDIDFCLQSCTKPLTYCMALEQKGDAYVQQHVGKEPSGQRFNAFLLNEDNLPHNPLINAGAIMTCSLISPSVPSERFEMMEHFFADLAGGARPGFDNATYLSEMENCERNFALSYFMKEHSAFPPNTDIVENLEFYTQVCSMTSTCNRSAVMCGTLANGGTCPVNGEKVLSWSTVRDCLSVMYTCGMYDYSGEFAFDVGLPAKSGVAGCILLVIPNVMGCAIWAPPLDKKGNSVRGVQVCKLLTARLHLHMFDLIAGERATLAMGRKADYINPDVVGHLFIAAAAHGDLEKLRKLMTANGADASTADYDGRSALHLAAAEGHVAVVRFLLERGANVHCKDRWGNTPRHEALKNVNACPPERVPLYEAIAALLPENIAATPRAPVAPAHAFADTSDESDDEGDGRGDGIDGDGGVGTVDTPYARASYEHQV